MVKAIIGATLIDGTEAGPLLGAVVVIDGARIAAVGPKARVNIPREAECIEAEGMAIMPGLIDAHIHVTMDGSTDPLKWTHLLTPFEAIQGVVNAGRLLDAGFTTVRDMGARGYADVAVKQAVEQGLVKGPRLLVSGHILTSTGGHADDYLRPDIDYRHEGVADGPDEMRRAARLQLKHGADQIKLMATGGVVGGVGQPSDAQLSLEEMAAAVAIAHRAGRRVAAHAHGSQGLKDALRAGVDSIEHGCYLDEEAAHMMIKQNVYLVPTLSAGYYILQHGLEGGIPDYAVRKAQDVWQHHLRSFRLAVDMGVPLAMGTDCGSPFNFAGQNAYELHLMVEQGMSPLQAIVTATSRGAACLGLSDQLGAIAPGKLADLLLVDGDPLADIGLLCDPARRVMVWKSGACDEKSSTSS